MFEVYFKEDVKFEKPFKVIKVIEHKGYISFVIYIDGDFKYIPSWRFIMKEE